MAEYAAKFEEFSRFYPYYNAMGTEVSKRLKFENELRPEINLFIVYHEIS